MKKLPIIIFILFVLSGQVISFAQGENNIWTFGHGYSLDFNYTPALLKDSVYWNGQSNRASVPSNLTFSYRRSSAVCDATGNLLFMVKFFDAQSAPDAPCIFDRNENPIAGTNFLHNSSHTDAVANKIPTIVPHPGNPKQYYIFYVRNRGLLYSLFDLSLNNGLGDIVVGEKDILVSNYNTVVGNTMTTVQGCDGIWLIARHYVNNGFLSFKVNRNGFQPVPVVSVAGFMFPISNLNSYSELMASPNGNKLAVASRRLDNFNIPGGIELYDFEKCSGRIKNTRVFDLGNDNYGITFSPDGSKLYVESNLPVTFPNQPYWQTEHNVYQFDLSLPTIADVELSKALILSNPTVQRDGAFCPDNIAWLGTMRIGPDGKLYVLNGAPAVCVGTSGVGLALHVINLPNLPGMACSPNLNAIFNVQNGMSGEGGDHRTNLPREIIYSPLTEVDTFINPVQDWNVCFKEKDTLSTIPGATCIEWNTGSTDSINVVSVDGKYWVRYFKDCQVYVDTFNVSFSKLPVFDPVQYGCPGFILLKAGDKNGPNFKLDLFNENGGKIYGGTLQPVHEIYNLDAGLYFLKISIGAHCDTMFEVHLKNYPIPDLTVSPPSAEILFGDAKELTANGAVNYIWEPAFSLNSRTESVVRAKPETTTVYSIIGINEYGCKDTATVSVKVTFNKNVKMPNAFTPNADGLNDVLKIPDGMFKVRRFEIYNRFGQLIFAEAGSNKGWNGTYKGSTCETGIYTYNVILDFPDETYILLKGDVTLLR